MPTLRRNAAQAKMEGMFTVKVRLKTSSKPFVPSCRDSGVSRERVPLDTRPAGALGANGI